MYNQYMIKMQLLCWQCIVLTSVANLSQMFTNAQEIVPTLTSDVNEDNTTYLPTSSSTTQQYCRYWDGFTDPYSFKLTTCAHCYYYLFSSAPLHPYGTVLFSVDMTNDSVIPYGSYVIPDRDNDNVSSLICKTLPTDDNCQQWHECCQAAEDCCQTQRQKQSISLTNNQKVPLDVEGSCPTTWDGFLCWGQLKADQTIKHACPLFIEHSMPSEDAYKMCTANGSWYRDPESDKEWTDYRTCLTFEDVIVTVAIKIVCNCLSLLVLIPSLVIFIYYRALRLQNRIRLHINLFVSFILYAVINLLWEVLIVYGKLKNPQESLMASNSSGCKLLNVLTIYTRSTNFVWMFCEGLYLHRLIIKAFQPPKQLILFYGIGWGFPWIYVGVYSILRIFVKNESCWVHDIGHFEWIVFAPNILALLTNFVFLIDILRILLTQIQCLPSEPSNYRRALKATFVLAPLFGLQLFLIIYRPPFGSTISRVYEMGSAFLVNSQGFFVALIFGLINKEVISHLKSTFRRSTRSRDDWNNTRVTNVPDDDSLTSSQETNLPNPTDNNNDIILTPMVTCDTNKTDIVVSPDYSNTNNANENMPILSNSTVEHNV